MLFKLPASTLKFCFSLTIVLFSQFVWAQPISMAQLIKSCQNSANLKHAQWSLSATYVDNGEMILSHQNEMSLAPASGLKLVTTAAALEILGTQFTFRTRLYYDGKISANGSLNGNIYIAGGGDPTLGSNQVKGSLPLDSLMDSWVAAVQAQGIKRIEGAILADDFLFDRNPLPDYWNWVDIGNYYGAASSALCINDNLYYLIFRPSPTIGQPAEVIGTDPAIPDLQFINYMRTGKPGSGDNGYIYCAPGQYTATLRGTIPAGTDKFKIKGSIPNPALFAAQEFRRNLKAAGIETGREAVVLASNQNYQYANLFHSTISPALQEIVYIINKRSFNLYAEQMLKMLAVVKGQTGSIENGLKIIELFFDERKIDRQGMEIYDGSGLSRTNMITTKTMVELLRFMSKQAHFEVYYNSLAIAGDSNDIGFFNNFGNGTIIAKNARIKSGLITNVRSHSGYVKSRSGRLIAFSFIANNYGGSLSQIDQMHKEILIKLAGL